MYEYEIHSSNGSGFLIGSSKNSVFTSTEEKMHFVRTRLSLWFLVMTFVMGMLTQLTSCSNEGIEEISETLETKGAITYNAIYQYESGDIRTANLTIDTLYNIFANYCGQLHPNNNRYQMKAKNGLVENQINIYEYSRRVGCVGDMLLTLIDNPAPLRLEKVKMVGTKDVFFNLDNQVYSTLTSSVEALEIIPPNAIKPREQLLQLALNQYSETIKNYKIMFSGVEVNGVKYKDEDIRLYFYQNMEDSWTKDLDPEGSSGAALLSQMASNITTTMSRFMDAKFQIVEQIIAEAKANGSNWASPDVSRIRALEHLIGVYDPTIDIYEDDNDNIFPVTFTSFSYIPEMTNELQNAIELLSDLDIDLMDYVNASNPTEDGITFIFDSLFKKLLNISNMKQIGLGLSPYPTIDDLALSLRTTPDDIKEACQYMYTHMTIFPRLPSKDGMAKWKAPFVSSSSAYFLRDMNVNNPSGSYYEEHTMGLLNRLKKMELDFANYFDRKYDPIPSDILINYGVSSDFADTTDAGDIASFDFVEAEKAEQDISSETKSIVNFFRYALGKKRLTYFIAKQTLEATDTHLVELNIEDAMMSKVEKEGEEARPLDHLRIYPIESAMTPMQQINVACARFDDGTLDACQGFRDSLKYLDSTNGMIWTCSYRAIDEQTNCNIKGYMELLDYKYWVIEMATSEDEVPSPMSWSPVTVISTDTTREYQWQNSDFGKKALGIVHLDGAIMDAVKKIVSIDADNINGSTCDPINGLDRECMDADWVPAIDNELIDPSNGYYETSYLHYLNLAGTAAEEAKVLREKLMEDIITEAQSSRIQESQIDSALDAYLAGIGEICGDDIIKEFEGYVREAEERIQEGGRIPGVSSFVEFLKTKEKLNKNYGCVNDDDSLTAHEKTGPVHCAVPRNCNLTSPTRLGDLGVFQSARSRNMWSAPIPLSPVWESKISANSFASIPGGFLQAASNSIWLATANAASSNDDPRNIANNDLEDECGQYRFSVKELLEPSGLFELPEAMMKKDYISAVKSKLTRLGCWAKDYKEIAKWYMSNESINYLPTIFKKPTDEGLFDTTLEGVVPTKYGDYYATLQDIATTIEDIRGTAESYELEYDKSIQNTVTLRNAIESNSKQMEFSDKQYELNVAFQIASAQAQETSFDHNLRQQTETCIQSVVNQFKTGSGSGNLSAFWSGLRNMSYHFGRNEYCNGCVDSPLRLNSRTEFLQNCEDVAAASGKIMGEYGQKICKILSNDYKLFTGWKIQEVPSEENNRALYYRCDRYICNFVEYKCDSDQSNNNGLGGCAYTFDELVADGNLYSPVVLSCYSDLESLPGGDSIEGKWGVSGGYSYTTNQPNAYSYNGPTIYSLCESGQHWTNGGKFKDEYNSANFWWDFKNYSTLASELRDAIYEIALKQCNDVYGCETDGTSITSCDGSGTYTKVTQKAENLRVSLGDLTREVEEINSLVSMDNFVEKSLVTAENLSTHRHQYSKLVRKLATLVGKLSSLEDKQISLFNRFINDHSIAKASSYSTLSEWNERYDFRRKAYEKQLRRARIAAWVARRAIEFRFGIDLSRESSTTIHGDAPKQWADDIYTTMASDCGIKPKPAAEEKGKTKITGCLAPEEQIEEYVQKLKDYVESYGNSPSQNWWFHEDDDTGVISVKNHLSAQGYRSATTVKHNLLYFSEEVDITKEKAEKEIYKSIWNELVEYYEEPMGWNASEGITIKPNREDLGVPSAVMDAHYSNERGIFDDQIDDYSSDLVTVKAGVDASLSQSIPISEMGFEGDRYDFTIFLRKKPTAWSDDELANPEKTCDLDVGEQFFPGIGRCGIPCEAEDSSLCTEGQVCIYAGDRWAENGAVEPAYICDWCSASRSCLVIDNAKDPSSGEEYPISGDAIPVELSIKEPSADGTTIAKNVVNVSPGWMRYRVNALENSTRNISEPTDSVEVSIKNVKTRNFVGSSEKPDLDCGWSYDGSAPIIDSDIPAPDGTYSAVRFDSIAGYRNLSIGTTTPIEAAEEGENHHFTGSIWMRSIDENDQQSYIDLSTSNSSDAWGVGKLVDVGPEWKRYSVSDTLNIIPSQLYLKYTSADSVLIWGAQIEAGKTATPYLPNGKNLLENSRDLNRWSDVYYNVKQPTEVLENSSPAGNGQVLRISDYDSTSFTGKYFDVTGEFSVGENYTFSIWAKSGDGQPQEVRLLQRYLSRGGYYVTPNESYEVDGKWRRLTLTATLTADSNGNPPEIIRVDFIPMCPMSGSNAVCASGTGAVDFWGPQFERGAYATGYQEVRPKNLISNSRDFLKWDNSAKLEVVNTAFEDGSRGVYRLVDESSRYVAAKTKVNNSGDLRIGDPLTFSIYLKADGSIENLPRIYIYEYMNGNSRYINRRNRTCGVSPMPGSGWLRCSVGMQIQGLNGVAPDYIMLTIIPLAQNPTETGSVLAYGPQLEKGAAPTSFTPTGSFPNLMPDGDMEEYDEASYMGWMMSWGSALNPAYTKVPSTRGAGRYALRITGNNQMIFTQTIIEPGSSPAKRSRYRISGWARGDGQCFPRINGRQSVYWQGTISTEWQYFDVTLNPTAPNLGLETYCNSAATNGFTEYDDMKVIRLDTPPPPTPTKNWGLDVGVVGAQVTKLSTFRCDGQGRPVFADNEDYDCEARYQNIRSTCCNDVDLWDGQGDHAAFYVQCMTCSDIEDESGATSCSDKHEECDPVSLCSHYIDADDLSNKNTCSRESRSYNRNTYLREHIEPGFEVVKYPNDPYPLPYRLDTYLSEEVRDALFRAKFKQFEGNGSKPGYYAYWFRLDMDSIENGSMGHFGVLAPNNFNYRLRTFAANIVGRDVLDCYRSEAPEECSTNQWITYDLKQMGDVRIRNHHKELSVRKFEIPTGRISGGKAWAAEQRIGYPMTGAHQGALAQMQKTALMGRPLQGSYELRIYDTPDLKWENVKDVQLVLGYHYWTRSE